MEFGTFLPKLWACQFVLKQGVPAPEEKVFALSCLCKVVQIKFLLVFHGAHQVTFKFWPKPISDPPIDMKWGEESKIPRVRSGTEL